MRAFPTPLPRNCGRTKKIFQEKALPSLPSGVVVEKEGHTGRVTIPLSNNHPELGTRREAIPDQIVFCSSNRTGFPFILSQFMNEGQNQRDVFDTCLANPQHGSNAFACPSLPISSSQRMQRS
jgi:hypothetical protein